MLGGLVTYAMSFAVDVWFLIPFAAGNSVHRRRGSEVNKAPSTRANVVHFAAFLVGAGIMVAATALD